MKSWINEKSIEAINRRFQSDLKYNLQSNILSGNLSFKATDEHGTSLSDCYNIEIHFNHCKPLPLVKEIGKRIEKLAKDKGKKLLDLHISSDNTLCLCGRLQSFEISENIQSKENPLLEFINQLIIPFLFGTTYFEKFNHWFCDEFSHHPKGLVPDAVNNPKLLSLYLIKYAKKFKKESCQFVREYLKYALDKNINVDLDLMRKYLQLNNFSFNRKSKRKNLKFKTKCLCGLKTSYGDCHRPILDLIEKLSK